MAQTASKDLAIGKGIVWLGAIADDATVPASDFRDVGNAPGLNLQVNSETLEHFSSRAELRLQDEDVILEINRTGTLTIDSISPENLAIYFLGSSSTFTDAGSTGDTEAFTNVTRGHGYQIGVSASEPGGARSVTLNSIERTSDDTPLVEGTDYIIDEDRGFIEILETSTVMTDGELATGFNIDYDVAAHTRTQVISGSTEITVSMRFESRNPKGQRLDYLFPKVKLRPSGDLGLISDEWMQVEFEVEVLAMGALAPIYLNGQPVAS